ncbi:hypothetical protein [Arthrobacter sp. L77]|uniref:hypothetical protein n=1 Tax=Arthrobacter sp. L77 TaxID=1496689 RepID=UPI0005BE23DD|nr:hypothetical protein [Arthrobacter sp. L77]
MTEDPAVTADDDAGRRAPNPRHRVTFGIGAVAVGFLVGLTTLALAFALSWGPDAPGVFLLALWYGVGVGVITGLPLGVVLGLLLRPVANQWIHVGVFFAVFTLASFAVITLLSPSRVLLESLPIALVIGGAGALARASVWKLVRVQEIGQ